MIVMDVQDNSVSKPDSFVIKLYTNFLKFINNAYVRFVFKKIIFYILVLFVALSLVWLIPRLLPGDPLNNIFASTGAGSGQWQEARKAELRAFYGLDKPLSDQFISYWNSLLHFDLGYSFDQVRITVISVLLPPFYLTMMLVLPVLFLGFFLGNYIGSKAAVNKGLRPKLAYYFGITFQSAPYYWTALLAMLFFFSLSIIFQSRIQRCFFFSTTNQEVLNFVQYTSLECQS